MHLTLATDRCTSGTHNCPENSICHTGQGLNYRCECRDGYEKDANDKCNEKGIPWSLIR